MNLKNFLKQIRVFAFVFCVLLSLLYSSHGYCATAGETNQYIQIPITQWREWKNELTALNQDLIQCQQELTRLRKPSAELVQQLQQAEKMLNELKQELAESKKDLTLASSEAAELRISLKKLREQIDKERRIHRRQIWQNRFWFLLGGVAIGYAVK